MIYRGRVNMSTLDDLRKCKTAEIYETWCVLDVLTNNLSFSTPELIITKNGITEANGISVLSAQNTLVSIDFCVQKGFFSDAFVLARKYMDDLMLCLFLFYKVLDVGKEDHKNIDNVFAAFSEPDFSEWFEKYLEETIQRESEDKDKVIIQNWQGDKYLGDSDSEESKRQAQNFFTVGKYVGTFKNKDGLSGEQAQKIEEAYKFIGPCWQSLSLHLNDYAHVNSVKTLRDNVYLTPERKKELSNDLFDSLQKTTVSFLALLVMIHPSSLSANDYVFFHETTGKWEEGLQYGIPSGITDYFGKYTNKVSPDLLQYIHENNPYGMRIILDELR